MSLTIPTHTSDSRSLYLRELWADGTDDGVSFELTRTSNMLMLDVNYENGVKIRQHIEIRDLIQAWLEQIDFETPEASL